MNGNVHRIPGVAQVTPGVAQAAQGVVGNSYSNYYRMLMSYYQSLYANRNQKNVNPILNNQNLAIGAWRNRQQVTNPYYMHVDFNISQNKKGNYKYPTTKTSDKDTAGHYKDKYPGVYWEGTYKEREKYSADDKYPHHQTGYHHTKHPKNYHHDPHHSKYPTDYPGDKYSDQKHKETYANGYLHDNYQKDYKGDKYSYDHYPNDRYPNEKYIGIHAYPHHDKNPHDYHTAYKYPGEKHKEIYPIGHLHPNIQTVKKVNITLMRSIQRTTTWIFTLLVIRFTVHELEVFFRSIFMTIRLALMEISWAYDHSEKEEGTNTFIRLLQEKLC